MNKTNDLVKLLERLNTGENPEIIKKEAQEFLATIDPAELSQAEQKLIEAGLDPAELRHLCSAHMEMLGDELSKLRENLEPGHVIHTMVCEHDMILGFLDDLEKINQLIQKMDHFEGEKDEFKRLLHIAEHLLEAEAHHQREEQVVFPALEERGVTGPPQIMRMEHEDLRKLKKELKGLADHMDTEDFTTFKKKLDSVTESIVPSLGNHIFKENNIIYPVALKTIKDSDVWQKMKEKCDNIGYCCFTPEYKQTGLTTN